MTYAVFIQCVGLSQAIALRPTGPSMSLCRTSNLVYNLHRINQLARILSQGSYRWYISHICYRHRPIGPIKYRPIVWIMNNSIKYSQQSINYKALNAWNSGHVSPGLPCSHPPQPNLTVELPHIHWYFPRLDYLTGLFYVTWLRHTVQLSVLSCDYITRLIHIYERNMPRRGRGFQNINSPITTYC